MKKWTQAEKNRLKQYYPIKGSKYCALLFNRSSRSVVAQASRLNLITTFVACGIPIRRWTEQEESVLIEHYSFRGGQHCSKIIDRSLSAVTNRANILGLFTDIVTNGSKQKQIIKILKDNKVIALCRKHGETSHYLQCDKISGCVKCNHQLMAKRAKTDEGRFYQKESHRRYRSTLVGKFAHRLRVLLRNVLKSKDATKIRKGCFRLLPYSPQELTQHLEKIRSFQDNKCPMCYKSYDTSRWTIDHVKPVKTAKNEKDVLELFCLDNLSLLCQSCNSRKGAKT